VVKLGSIIAPRELVSLSGDGDEALAHAYSANA
jgi:hypothetical protein